VSGEGLTIVRDGAVLRARIDSGPGNLFTPAMSAGLAAMLRTPPDGVHLLHLSAAGDEFCVGRAPFRDGAKALREDVDVLVEVIDALQHTSIVTVAEVQGDAAGFGVGLVALSDVALAAPEARFYFPEVDAGFAPALVLAWLGEIVGRRNAFWLAATGVRLPARAACEIGLVTHVVDDRAGLGTAATGVMELLLAKPPDVHAQIKELMRLYAALPADERSGVAADKLAFGALRRAFAGPPS
jgi:enoyl-CoA hydratase/carnithine racemase